MALKGSYMYGSIANQRTMYDIVPIGAKEQCSFSKFGSVIQFILGYSYVNALIFVLNIRHRNRCICQSGYLLSKFLLTLHSHDFYSRKMQRHRKLVKSVIFGHKPF